MAAVIVLMPVVVKYIMGGLMPISEVARTKLQKNSKIQNSILVLIVLYSLVIL